MSKHKKEFTFTFLASSSIFASILAPNALAVTIGFDTFTGSGDAVTNFNSADISTASNTIQDDFPSPIGTFNFSGTSAVDATTLASFLNVPVSSLDPDPDNFILAFEGSAIKRDFNNVVANTEISFNWNFLTNENGALFTDDYAFVAIDDQIIPLADISDATQISSPFALETGVNSYNFTFPQDGDYTIALGVLDVFDGVDSSALSLTNLQLNPPGMTTPEPTLAIALLGLGLIGVANKSVKNKAKK